MRMTDIAANLIKGLGKVPERAERFYLESFAVDVLIFEDRPFKGANSLVTVGVSKLDDRQAELVVVYDPESLNKDTDLSGFTMTYLQHYFLNSRATYGDLFIRSQSVLNGYDFSGVYITSPSYFSDDALLETDGLKFLWLVLLHEKEVEYACDKGVLKLEELLEDMDPDLSDFRRPSMI